MKLRKERQFPTHPQKGKVTMKLMKYIYKEPNLEIEIEKKAIIDEEIFIKIELDAKQS